ncbi:hypothetical protein [Methanosphaera sp.]
MEFKIDNDVIEVFKTKLKKTYIPEYEYNYKKFRKLYAPNVLKELEGVELLERMFRSNKSSSNLCIDLEHDNNYSSGGSMKGGTSYKFSLYEKKGSGWTYGNSSKSAELLTESEAIMVGSAIRDALVSSCDLISESTLESIADYEELNMRLEDIFSDVKANPRLMWIHKYFHMIFPDKFTVIHTDDKRSAFLNSEFNVSSEYSAYGKDGEIFSIANAIGLTRKEMNEYILATINRDYWILTIDYDQWDTFKTKNIISIDWNEIGTLTNANKNRLIKKYCKVYPNDINQEESIDILLSFSNGMKKGDIVFIQDEEYNLLGYCAIESDYTYLNMSDELCKHRRFVKWIKTGCYENLFEQPLTAVLTNITLYTFENLKVPCYEALINRFIK